MKRLAFFAKLKCYSTYCVDVAGLPNVTDELLQFQRLDIALSPMFWSEGVT